MGTQGSNTTMYMHKLEYYINNKLKETIFYSAPKALCLFKKNTLKATTHRLGVFKIIPV